MQSPSEGDVLRGHVIQEDLGGQQRRFGIIASVVQGGP